MAGNKNITPRSNFIMVRPFLLSHNQHQDTQSAAKELLREQPTAKDRPCSCPGPLLWIRIVVQILRIQRSWERRTVHGLRCKTHKAAQAASGSEELRELAAV